MSRIRPSALMTKIDGNLIYEKLYKSLLGLMGLEDEVASEASVLLETMIVALTSCPNAWYGLKFVINQILDYDDEFSRLLYVINAIAGSSKANVYLFTDTIVPQLVNKLTNIWDFLVVKEYEEFASLHFQFFTVCVHCLDLPTLNSPFARLALSWCEKFLPSTNDNRLTPTIIALSLFIRSTKSLNYIPITIPASNMPNDVMLAIDTLNATLVNTGIDFDKQFSNPEWTELRNNLQSIPPLNFTNQDPQNLLVFAKGPFRSVTNSEKKDFLQQLGKYICHSTGCLNISAYCQYCDRPDLIYGMTKSRPASKLLTHTFDSLLSTIKDSNSTSIKLLFIQLFYRFFYHYEPVRLESTIGVWLIGRLNCGSRALRVAATKVLPYFSQSSEKDNNDNENLLRILNEVCVNGSLVETNIMAWCEVAKVSEGESLNVVLLRLLEGLVDDNTIVNSLTIHALDLVAKYRKVQPVPLFSTFWSTIGIDVVRRLESHPNYIKRVAEFLEITEYEFLQKTQEFTVPYLILGKQYSIISKVAGTDSKEGLQKFLITHMPNILSLLLIKVVENWGHEEDPLTVVKALINECGVFELLDFTVVASPHMQSATFGILRYYNGNNYQLVGKALQALSKIKYKKGIDAMLNDNTVPQLTMYSSGIIQNQKPYTQKIESLYGLQMLMLIAPEDVSGKVVHQVCAILQSCLDDELLRLQALKTWLVVVQNLNKSALESILALTFSLIVQRWDEFDGDCCKVAQNIVDFLSFERFELLRGVLQEAGLPSLASIPELVKTDNALLQSIEEQSPIYKLNTLLLRCQDENVHVVRQTITELRDLLLKTDVVAIALSTDRTVKYVRDLMRTLLSVPSQFPLDVAELCSECLGLVGALDHHIVNISPEKHDFVLVDNFASASESQELVVILLNTYLVNSYRALTDPLTQLFLAYGIQELLKFCDLRPNNYNQSPYWKQFSSTCQSTLFPLLSSKYSAPKLIIPEGAKYPIYKGQNHIQWLDTFATDLMFKVQGKNAETVFHVFLRATRNLTSGTLLNFLLPYAALNVVLTNQKNRDNILTEILAILNNSTADIPFHQTIFVLVDYLAKWVRKKRIDATSNKQKTSQDETIVIVENMLNNISSELLATRSFECKSYPRAIMYWEDHLRRHETELSQDEKNAIYKKFQEIYSSIDDPDSLDGIAAKFKEFGPDQQVLRYESTGKWDYALECYEALSHWDLDTKGKIYRCLKQSGRYEDLLSRLNSEPDVENWVKLGVEVSWLSSDWDKLQSWLTKGNKDDYYETHIGNALMAVKGSDGNKLRECINKARQGVAKDISAINITSLAQCHDDLIKLHALTDLEDVVIRKRGQNSLDTRLQVVGSDYTARRHLLALQRSAIMLTTNDKNMIAMSWLKTAQDSRAQGQNSMALQSSIKTCNYGNELGKVENARVLWEQGEQRKAPAMLETILSDEVLKTLYNYKQFKNIKQITREEAEVAMLYTTWLDESNQEASEALLMRYKALTKLQPQWENVHYMLAKYYNKLFDSQKDLPEESRNISFMDGSYVGYMCLNYIRSLSYGVKYIYETLPKLITVWLDFAANINKVGNTSSGRNQQEIISTRKRQLSAINTHIRNYSGRLPGYIFYMVLPQLLSRMLHENEEVGSVIKTLVVEITSHYPHQALWYVLGNANSTEEKRNLCGKRILDKLRVTKAANYNLRHLVEDAVTMTASLINLSKKKVQKGQTHISLDQLGFKKSSLPSNLVVPVQQMISTTLPSHPQGIKNHKAFPNRVTIHRIDDNVTIQNSLQKPKRIVMIGTDGQRYKILCKSNDDVRKDARLMEFARSIDKLFKTDIEASQRHLRINTYHVTPMTELCGLIEWVEGADAMRTHIHNLSRAKNNAINWAQAKSLYDNTANNPTERKQAFEQLKAKYPPVLHEWFIETFADPSSWLDARTNFARTLAVMSIVGFIVGLGDRHSENLLIIQKTGEIMHVDFDMLFDKGLTLGEPERVPFRLTQQLESSMGVSGYEGLFRKSCEVVLKVLREHESMLMTVLEPFLHEPFVEWTDKKTINKNAYAVMINGLKASRSPQEAFNTIRNKIRGIKSTNDGIPLSVSGQVEYLIKLATDEHNLSQMYIGWGAFM